MSRGTDATIVGAVVATVVGIAPRAFDRLTGRRHDDADTAALVSTGAGAVTSAALALLEQVQEERDTCRADLAAVNARCDALERRIADLHP